MKETALSRFRLATYILAGVFALSTALLVGILTADRSTEPVTPGVPPADWEPYTLQPGDTLRELARSRDVPLKSVLRANGIEDRDVAVGQEVYLPATTTSEPRAALLNASTLTAAGAFITSVGSLVGVVLTYLRSRREMELADRRHRREVDLEKAKLKLERLRLEGGRQREDDEPMRASVE